MEDFKTSTIEGMKVTATFGGEGVDPKDLAEEITGETMNDQFGNVDVVEVEEIYDSGETYEKIEVVEVWDHEHDYPKGPMETLVALTEEAVKGSIEAVKGSIECEFEDSSSKMNEQELGKALKDKFFGFLNEDARLN